jgi:hypothetical protein
MGPLPAMPIKCAISLDATGAVFSNVSIVASP